MPSTTIQQLRDDLRKLVEQDPAYQGFLESVARAEEAIRALHKPDPSGRYKTLTREDRDALLRLHSEIGAQAESVLREEADKPRRDLVRKLTALAAGNHRTLLSYAPEQEPRSLPSLLSDVRTLTMDVRGMALHFTESNQPGLSQPIRFLDDKGREISGVFAPRKELQVRKALQQKLAQLLPQVSDHTGRRILQNFFDRTVSWAAQKTNCDLASWPEHRKPALLAPFLEEIGVSGPQSIPNQRSLERTMTEIFAEELDGKHLHSVLPETLLQELGQSIAALSADVTGPLSAGKIPDGSRLDTRSAAVSAVADLLGVSGIVARARPMKMILKDDEALDGTFLAEAAGLDPKHLGKEAMGIDESALEISTAEDLAARCNALKNLADLQILDYLCGNVTRHSANMRYQFTERKKFRGVQGIGNDCALGLVTPRPDQEEAALPALQNMRVISASMARTVEHLSPALFRFSLRGFGLSEAELDGCCYRLNTLKQQLEADKAFSRETHSAKFKKGHLLVVEDRDWANIKFSHCSVSRQEAAANEPGLMKNLPANTFAQAMSAVAGLGRAYQLQERASRTQQHAPIQGVGSRATPGKAVRTPEPSGSSVHSSAPLQS